MHSAGGKRNARRTVSETVCQIMCRDLRGYRFTKGSGKTALCHGLSAKNSVGSRRHVHTTGRCPKSPRRFLSPINASNSRLSLCLKFVFPTIDPIVGTCFRRSLQFRLHRFRRTNRRGEAMSSPVAGTESPNFLPSKTAVFSSKQAGGDTAPPLHGVCVICNRLQIRWCKHLDKL